MRSRLQRTLPLLLIFVGLATTTRADKPAQLLGSEGEIYALHTGAYGMLFPGGLQDDPDNNVLALEVREPDGERQMVVVPDSLGPDFESTPVLLDDIASSTLYLLWESWTGIHSRFFLSTFDGATWSPAIEVTGAPFAQKSSPSIAVTRDVSERIGGDAETGALRNRTVVHLVWLQEMVNGQSEAMYAPLVIEDGRYVGQHPAVHLEELVRGEEPVASGPLPFVEPTISAGKESRTVVVSFLSPVVGRLVVAEIGLVPGEISELGDSLRIAVETAGEANDLSKPEGVAKVADDARHHLIDIGARLKTELIESLAASTTGYIRSLVPGADGPQAIAEGARHHLIDIGVDLADSRLTKVVGDARHHLIDIGVRATIDQDGGPRDFTSDLQVRRIALRSLPQPMADELEIYVSPSGGAALAAWATTTAVSYQETTGDAGWSQVHTLHLGKNLSREAVQDILQNRIRNR